MPPVLTVQQARQVADEELDAYRVSLFEAAADEEVAAEEVHRLIDAINLRVASLAQGEPTEQLADVLADTAERAARQRAEFDHLQTAFRAGEDWAVSRMGSLASIPRNTFEEALRRTALDSGFTEERRFLPETGCSDECKALAEKGWSPIGSLPEVFDTENMTECGCCFDYKGQPAEFASIPTTGELAQSALKGVKTLTDLAGKGAVAGGRYLGNLNRRYAGGYSTGDTGGSGRWYEMEDRDPRGRWAGGGGGAHLTVTPGERPGKLASPRDTVMDRDGLPSVMHFEDRGAIRPGGDKVLVHVGDDGVVDHGPGNVLGRRVEEVHGHKGVVPGGDSVIRPFQPLKPIGLKGKPLDVANAHVEREAFNANAGQEIDHMVDSVRKNKGDDQASKLDAVLRKAHVAIQQKFGPSGEDKDALEVRKGLEDGAYDPRKLLLAHAEHTPGVLEKSDPHPLVSTGDVHRAGGQYVHAPGLTARSLRSLQNGFHSEAVGTVLNHVNAHAYPGAASYENVENIRGRVAKLTNEEARAVTGKLGLGEHHVDSKAAADAVAEHVSKVSDVHRHEARRLQGEIAGVRGQLQDSEKSRHQLQQEKTAKIIADADASLARSGDTLARAGFQLHLRRGQVAQSAGVLKQMERHPALHAGLVKEAGQSLRKGFTLEGLGQLHKAVHGTDLPAGTRTKRAAIRHVLSKHIAQAAVSPDLHFAENQDIFFEKDPEECPLEAVIHFDGQLVTFGAAAEELEARGLSQEAAELVLSHCELADDDSHDDLLRPALMAMSMKIQSLLFPVDQYTKDEATKWAGDNDFVHSKVDTTDQYHRLRQFDPDDCKGEPRTIAFKKAKGVKAVVCQRPVENSDEPEPADEEFDFVHYSGHVWDSISVIHELTEAGFSDFKAAEYLSAFPCADFAGKSPDDQQTDDKGRTFIWRTIHGSPLKIYTDGGSPAMEPPHWMAQKIAAGGADAQKYQAILDTANAHGKVQKAVNKAKEDGHGAKKQIQVAVKAAHQSVGIAKKQVDAQVDAQKKRSVGEAAKKIVQGAAGRVSEAAKAAGRRALQAAGKAGAVIREGAGKIREDLRATKRVAAVAAQKARDDLRAAGHHGGKAAKAVDKAALGHTGKALAEAHAITAAKAFGRAKPKRRPGESKEAFEERKKQHRDDRIVKRRAVEARAVNSLRAKVKDSWMPHVATRAKLLGNWAKQKLMAARLLPSPKTREERKAAGKQEEAGWVTRTAAKGISLVIGLKKYANSVSKLGARRLENHLKEKYPGMPGKAATYVAKTLTHVWTAHAILGAAGAATAAVAAGSPLLAGLAVGGAATALLDNSTKKFVCAAGVAGLMGATSGITNGLKGIASLVSRKKATSMSADFADWDDDSSLDDPDMDYDLKPEDIPDDIDWQEIEKQAQQEAVETAGKFLQWAVQHRDDPQYKDFFDTISQGDEPPDDILHGMAAASPLGKKSLFSLSDDDTLAVDRRATFLASLPAAAEFRAAYHDLAHAAQEDFVSEYGHEHLALFRSGALLEPVPDGRILAGFADPFDSSEVEDDHDLPLISLEPEEAFEMGAEVARAACAGWRA